MLLQTSLLLKCIKPAQEEPLTIELLLLMYWIDNLLSALCLGYISRPQALKSKHSVWITQSAMCSVRLCVAADILSNLLSPRFIYGCTNCIPYNIAHCLFQSYICQFSVFCIFTPCKFAWYFLLRA